MGSSDISTGIRMRTLTSLPKLVATGGPCAGASLVMSSTLATAGRHPTNDLVLDDPQVSAVHVELRRVGERLRVHDAGSATGTWLGAHRVTDVEVAAGGEFTIGGTTLRVALDDQSSTAEVSILQSFGELVGQSAAMREVFATLERAAPESVAVLVQGEAGTGKEELARAVHARSSRASHPFTVVDVAALRRSGSLEAAPRGTLFVAGAAGLSPSLQAQLLQVLEKGDVRVVSAAERDLRHEIERGHFREDLYRRLSEVRVVLAPLRDRLEDVPLLSQKVLRALPGPRNVPVLIEQAALEALATRAWPGNVRELRDVLARAASLAEDGIVRRQDVVC
jgi:DNA-binding NtrC family response regulator